MKDPLVSIVIPMFNTGNSCLKLIKTLQKSTYKNIEIVCVDDGSTDESYELIQNYASKQKNIVLKKQKNAGPSAARNAGLKYASGKWVSFVDSDDEVDKTFIEKLVRAYDDNTILASTALQYNRIASGASYPDFMKTLRPRKTHEGVKEYIAYAMSQDGRLYGIINKLFRRDIINENKLRFDVSLDFAEDTKFVLDYIDAAIKYYPEDCEMKFIYEPLYTYNFGTETSTVVKSSLSWDNWKTSYVNLDAWVKNDLTLSLQIRKRLIWCRWRISHALAVSRSQMSYKDKRKYLNFIELWIACLLLKIRK